MVDINPFFDSDIRNGLQYLSGVNILVIVIAFVVDALAILEAIEFSSSWNPDSFFLPVLAGYVLLGCDMFINFLQLFGGWTLYTSVSHKSYRRIQQLYWPTLALLLIELGIIVGYLVCIPSSPYFYYFSVITLAFKVFVAWPLKRFINDHSHHTQRPRNRVTERTRLLASIA